MAVTMAEITKLRKISGAPGSTLIVDNVKVVAEK